MAGRAQSPKEAWTLVDTLIRDRGASLVSPARPRCTRGHPCERVAAGRTNRRPVCDGCRRSGLHQSQGVFWTCWACDHDLCQACGDVPPVAALLDSETEELQKALEEGLAEKTSLEEWTALHYAAACGRTAAAKALLEAGALATAEDSRGLLPLHWASLMGHGKLVEELLAAGSSADAADSSGRVALSLLPTEFLRYAFVCDGTEGDVDAAAGSSEVSTDEFIVQNGGSEEKPPPQPGARLPFGRYCRDGEASGRPRYRRMAPDGSCRVGWSEEHGWAMYHGSELLCRSEATTRRCPRIGWTWVQPPEGDGSAPPPVVLEELPWRAGNALLAATPIALRPPHVRAAVEALPKRQPRVAAPGAPVVTLSIGGPDGQTREIHMPAPGSVVTGAGGMVHPPFELLMQEMVRRGEMPPEPPAQCTHQ